MTEIEQLRAAFLEQAALFSKTLAVCIDLATQVKNLEGSHQRLMDRVTELEAEVQAAREDYRGYTFRTLVERLDSDFATARDRHDD